MASRMNWTPGRQGKGNWYKNGDISTWNIDDEMNPHHHEVAMREMNDADVHAAEPGWFFYINPEGGIHDGGISFNNQTPHTDDQVMQKVIEQGEPFLYNGSNDENNYDSEDAEPRYEMADGGYGHAQNLLNILSKIAKDDNWADFHTELKLPRGVRQRIRRWVDKLKWPEGSEKADARTYHITILSMDEYDDEFAKWARKEMRGRYFTFKTTGMDIFADEHVVLRMGCPEWTELVRKWAALADDKGLKPRKFEPPKAHVTIGKSPSGKWPQGVPDPHIKFDARQFNINKNSSMSEFEEDQYPSGRSLESEPKEPDEELAASNGDSVVRYDDSWYVTDGTDGDYISGPWSDEDEARSINRDEWRQSSEQTIADELRSWLQHRRPTRPLPTVQPPSLHHTDADQFMPEVVAPQSVGPHVDPPSKPYEPYNWAADGWEESPLNLTASTRTCAQCGAEIDGPICSECGYDPTHADSDYERSKANWYERAWDDAGKNQPRQVPNQPMHWRDNHAKDVKFASGIDQRDSSRTVGSALWVSPRQNHSQSSDEDPADISTSTTSLNNSIDDWREI